MATFAELPPEKVFAVADRQVATIEEIELTPGTQLLARAILLMAQEGLRQPSELADKIDCIWQEFECQGYLNMTRGFIGINEED